MQRGKTVPKKNCRLTSRDIGELILLAIDYPIDKKTALKMCSGRNPIRPGAQIYGICDGSGKLVSIMTASFNYVFPHDDGKRGRMVHISGAFSHRDSRGQGYATRLIEAIEKDARRYFKADYLCCDSTADELYAGSGFVHAPTDETRLWKPLT